MYSKVGMELLGLLHGSFTFVLYESKMVRRGGVAWGGTRYNMRQHLPTASTTPPGPDPLP